MSRARDDARRNARGAFAVNRADGSPVGSKLVSFQDGCCDAFYADGAPLQSSFTSDHNDADHMPWMKGPFSWERWDDLTRIDDYDDWGTS